jgi:hypothetical protein
MAFRRETLEHISGFDENLGPGTIFKAAKNAVASLKGCLSREVYFAARLAVSYMKACKQKIYWDLRGTIGAARRGFSADVRPSLEIYGLRYGIRHHLTLAPPSPNSARISLISVCPETI